MIKISKLFLSAYAASALVGCTRIKDLHAQDRRTDNKMATLVVVVTPIGSSGKYDRNNSGERFSKSIRSRARGNVRISVVDYKNVTSLLEQSGYPIDEVLSEGDRLQFATALRGDVVISGTTEKDSLISLTIQTVSTPSYSENISIATTKIETINNYFEQVSTSIVCLLNPAESSADINIPELGEQSSQTGTSSIFPEMCRLKTSTSTDSVLAIASRMLRKDPKQRNALEAVARLRDTSIKVLFAPKDEFETTTDYSNRTQQARTRLLGAMTFISDSIQNELSRLRKGSRKALELKAGDYSLEPYDADRELFGIKIGDTKGFFFVARDEAREFRNNIEKIKVIANQELNPVSNNLETMFYTVVLEEMNIRSNVTARSVDSNSPSSPSETEDSQVFFDFQVDKIAVELPPKCKKTLFGVCGTTLRYPDILLSAGITGEVTAQFVVDTLGRVELNSFKVIRSNHDLFTSSVRRALSEIQFLPAEKDGRKVRMLVQQEFKFDRAR